MTNLQTLHDAFAELEREADAYQPLPAPRRRLVLAPVAATVAVVAALVVGAMWLVPGDTPTTTAAAGPPTTYDELAARFQAVLGDKATLEVVETGKPEDVGPGGVRWPAGLSIAGPLTADGVTGWFRLDFFAAEPCQALPAGSDTDEPRGADARAAGYSVLGYGPGGCGRLQLTVLSERHLTPEHSPDHKPPLTFEETMGAAESTLWW